MTNAKTQVGILDSPAVITAKRALGFGKMYIVIALFIALISITILNYGYLSKAISLAGNMTSNSVSSNTMTTNGVAAGAQSSIQNDGTPLLQVPFDVLPSIMLVTPIVILFVYDKNNGVLEYMLSLGMTQRDIYLRYLKAAILIVIVYLLFFASANAAYSYIKFGAKTAMSVLQILLVAAIIALSTVAFMITMMMTFSSLQKSRAGGNQPLAITLGMVGVIPGYLIPFAFSFTTGIAIEVAEAIIISLVALVLLALSGKLIKREKILP
jgi:hypothetical protein